MESTKISSLIALSLVTSPIALSSQETSQGALKTSSIRSSHRNMKYRTMPSLQLLPKGIYVGELQERWQFPSDHLPVGITYDDLHIGSWNVLDANYMDWVYKNTQGLSNSLITEEHVYVGETRLTIRDMRVADMVTEMLTHPTHPRSILSLQEINAEFLEHLKSKLPQNIGIISNSGNAVLFDENLLEAAQVRDVFGVFSESPQRPFQEILFQRKDTGEALRVFNVHLPGNPIGPGRFEFTQYLAKVNDPNISSIAMGDMNFNELEMKDALLGAFEGAEFQIFSPYCTNISVTGSENPLTSKAIDHFILNSSKEVKMNSAEEVWIGLDQTYRLLNR